MTKVILHICTSIDGFIADEEGNSDFVFEAQETDPEFEKFYDSKNSKKAQAKSNYCKNAKLPIVCPQIQKEKANKNKKSQAKIFCKNKNLWNSKLLKLHNFLMLKLLETQKP